VIIRKIERKTALRKKRVAAYARVSTEAEEQQESLRTQVNYYETFIRQNPTWEYVQVYADPGRSGTGAANRPGFQQMVSDAKAGKLDVILVKSISRFARNVADAQKYVHELKAHEVEVRFEREAISSFDPASDMIFSVLAAVAQEESRSISENVKWSYRKHAEKGIRRLGNNRVLGYDTDKSGKLVPNGDAWIVRQIFADYANDLPLGLIVQRINEAGAKRLRSDKPFTTDAILRLLDNELYVGDRMIQKEAPHNYLTKRPDPTVSYKHYYVTDDHEAIVDRETWARVYERRTKRHDESKKGIHRKANSHFLYGIVYCAECGAPYKRRTMKGHNGESYKTWNCAERQKGNGCGGPMIRETVLLKDVSDSLGWLWVDEQQFNADLFLDAVRRIEVGKDGVKVELKEAA